MTVGKFSRLVDLPHIIELKKLTVKKTKKEKKIIAYCLIHTTHHHYPNYYQANIFPKQ